MFSRLPHSRLQLAYLSAIVSDILGVLEIADDEADEVGTHFHRFLKTCSYQPWVVHGRGRLRQ